MILTRQNLPVLPRGNGFAAASEVSKGGYVLVDGSRPNLDLILVASGSEVQFAVAARETLESEGISTRVISMPCVEWFDEQATDYQNQVLPKSVTARVSIEAGLTIGWRGIVGDSGISIGIDHYGASADYQTLYQEFGITTEAVVAAGRKLVEGENK